MLTDGSLAQPSPAHVTYRSLRLLTSSESTYMMIWSADVCLGRPPHPRTYHPTIDLGMRLVPRSTSGTYKCLCSPAFHFYILMARRTLKASVKMCKGHRVSLRVETILYLRRTAHYTSYTADRGEESG